MKCVIHLIIHVIHHYAGEILPKFCQNSAETLIAIATHIFKITCHFVLRSILEMFEIFPRGNALRIEITYYAHAHGLFLWKSLSLFFACVHFSAFPESKHHHITHQMILNLEELSLGIDYVENLIRTMNAWKLYFARLTHEFLEFKPNECSFDSVKLTCHHFVIQIYLTDFSHIEINSISMICCFFFGNRQFERVFVLFSISLFLCSFCSTLISKRNARCWICISKC